MVAWRVAKSLDQLLRQVDAEAPHRSKSSDGSIGDAAHQTRESDHNPWVGPVGGLWIVTARDFTHDPAGGFDAYDFAEILKARKDPRVKYVISNWRIWSLARDREGWRKYNGENGHTHHTHVSCTYSYPLFDSTKAWNLTPPGHAPGDTPTRPEDELDMDETRLREIIADELNKQDAQLWANTGGTGKKLVIERLERVEKAVNEIKAKVQ